MQAFAQIGNTMYVGGNFTTVQKGAESGADKVAQPYLAAFDATHRRLDQLVPADLQQPGQGARGAARQQLAVGGDFTKVNGTARRGLVVLDPSTGALDPLWDANLENRVTGSRAVSVRGLDTSGTHLYATGAFTHFVRGTSAIFARNGARLSLSTVAPTAAGTPTSTAPATGVDVDDNGSRVYFSGYFTQSGSATADRAAAVSTGATASLPRLAADAQHVRSRSTSRRSSRSATRSGSAARSTTCSATTPAPSR